MELQQRINAFIKLGACEPECPNTAIYEGADDWRYKDGTSLEAV